MSGMEMMLVNMLKAFMPKEAAEKIAGYATDGTFDRIGAIPSELDEIKTRLKQIEFILAGMARRAAIDHQRTLLNHEPERANQVSGIAIGSGLDPASSSEHGTDGIGDVAGTGGISYNGHAGNL